MAKRPRVGDVFEVVAGQRLIYVQYVGKHPDYGAGILVCPRVHTRRPSIEQELFAGAYITFYPLGAAVSQGLVSVVGNVAAPELPIAYRREGAIAADGTVLTWIIEGPSGEIVKESLTDDERMLTIAGIWNHEFLVNRVISGWRPEMEG